MKKNVIAYTEKGWERVQLENVIKLQKSWTFKEGEYRVDIYFGNMDGVPVIATNVYFNGHGTRIAVDRDYKIWKNSFVEVDKEFSNSYCAYLRKQRFLVAES